MSMTTAEFNQIKVGDLVTVDKTGKVYAAYTVETEEKLRQDRARDLADPEYARYVSTAEVFEKWIAETACPGGINRVFFVQRRANSKGVVVNYGPTRPLMPSSISLAF